MTDKHDLHGIFAWISYYLYILSRSKQILANATYYFSSNNISSGNPAMGMILSYHKGIRRFSTLKNIADTSEPCHNS
jgi:hypothetical protein